MTSGRVLLTVALLLLGLCAPGRIAASSVVVDSGDAADADHGTAWEPRLLASAIERANVSGAPLGYDVVDRFASGPVAGVAYRNTSTGVVYIAFTAAAAATAWGRSELDGDLAAVRRAAEQFTDRVAARTPGHALRLTGAGAGGVLAQLESARTRMPADVFGSPAADALIARGVRALEPPRIRRHPSLDQIPEPRAPDAALFYTDAEVAAGLPALDAQRVPLVVVRVGIR
jgi:hypothetical protein